MPSNVKMEDMKSYKAPTLLISRDKDVLFPGKKVIESAKKSISDLKVHLLEDSGHRYFFFKENIQYVNNRITEFLN